MKDYENEKKNLHNLVKVGLWIDSYDDIFSDFDPRPYTERRLSDDFLYELRKEIKFKTSGKFELTILVQKNLRNFDDEEKIKERIIKHFNDSFNQTKKDIKKIFNDGLKFVFIGICLMFIASYLLWNYPQNNFIINFLIFLLEPASWFSFWEGLRQIVFETKDKRKELEFYNKMCEMDIKFLGY
ncbi:MAG: hypothetical protein ACK4YO_01165 [Candidatus Altarchaeaceae archaeon]